MLKILMKPCLGSYFEAIFMIDDTPIHTLSDYCSKEKFISNPGNPLKKSQLDWIFRNRHTNGFKDSFIKVSSRAYLVHIPTFIQCLEARRCR